MIKNQFPDGTTEINDIDKNILKTLFSRFKFVSEDKAYIRHFDADISPGIYKGHLDGCFVCCAFCQHLQKSSCHEYCFTCLKRTYMECSTLLPGIFSFVGSHFDAMESTHTPWIFKTPCTAFERLSKKKYFKNFNSNSQSITVANYEALEGIFTGISRGKSPCHICASVNIGIYNDCVRSDKNAEYRYCKEIIDQIRARYRVISGMIKYME